MNDNITRYKRIIESNRLKSDTVDTDVKNIISKVGVAMPELLRQDVRNVKLTANAVSALITNFEYYTQAKEEINSKGIDQ